MYVNWKVGTVIGSNESVETSNYTCFWNFDSTLISYEKNTLHLAYFEFVPFDGTNSE